MIFINIFIMNKKLFLNPFSGGINYVLNNLQMENIATQNDKILKNYF